MSSESDIKTMKLYHQVERVFNELTALGIGPEDVIPVEQLSAFDQYHYLGTEAVEEAVRRLGIDSSMSVLEVGGGIGGPSRHLAHRTGCAMTVLELQPDLNATAAELTGRCGLAARVNHVCGNVLDGVEPGEGYDALVSWLTFLHIPERERLYARCFEALKPGAGIYVEDFFAANPLRESEKRSLSHDIFCDHVPTLSDYETQLSAVGFCDIELIDMTSVWRDFVLERIDAFRAARERNLELHGREIVEGLEEFYAAVDTLFAGGNLGGLRLVAWKR